MTENAIKLVITEGMPFDNGELAWEWTKQLRENVADYEFLERRMTAPIGPTAWRSRPMCYPLWEEMYDPTTRATITLFRCPEER